MVDANFVSGIMEVFEMDFCDFTTDLSIIRRDFSGFMEEFLFTDLSFFPTMETFLTANGNFINMKQEEETIYSTTKFSLP